MSDRKLVIEASEKNFAPDFKELFQYKDLFLVMAYRDFKVRYAQTFLGFIWGFIQPVVTLTIFTLVFGAVRKVDTGSIPYPVFALCGMVAWTYFAFVMGQAGDSIIGAQGMVKKVYFPRLIIPLSKALVGLVDFTIIFVFLGVVMLYSGVIPSSKVIFLPVFIIFVMFASLGAGIWLSALTIRFRDFKHMVPFMIQGGLFLSPVGYPSSQVPEKFQLIYHLNPMAGIIEGFRFAILEVPMSEYAWVSFLVAFLLFVTSVFYFRTVEKVIADLV